MQTTEPMTAEMAAESLLAPQEEPVEQQEAEEAETVETEAETDDATPTEEADAEDAEEEAEDAEVEDDEGEDEDDDEEADEDEQPAERYTVKVDGEEREVTLEELKRGYSGQEYIQKRMQEVGEKVRETEAAYNQFTQLNAQLQQFAQSVQQQGIMPPPQPPARELLDSDPIAYMEAKADYEQAVQSYTYQQQQLQAYQQHQQQAEQMARQHYLREQQQKLIEAMPELADAETADKFKKDLRKVATDAYGFTDEELSRVDDARHVQVLRDAMKYRELMANKDKAAKKVKQARPTVKAGSKNKVDPKRKQRNEAMQRLKKTGSIDDAVSLIMET